MRTHGVFGGAVRAAFRRAACRSDSGWRAAALLAVLPVISQQDSRAADERLPPNFVVIMADDLGYGDLGCYDGRARTPHLDRLAREGLRFTDFHSNGSVCSPTRAAFLTGRYQQRCGILTALGEGAPGLPREEKTIPEYLQERGYASALIGKWHLGYHPENGPLQHGFDYFRGHLHGAFDYVSKVDQWGRHDWWHDDRAVPDETYATELITKHTVEFLTASRARPFFAFVSHSAIHFPWQAPGDPSQRKPGGRYEDVTGPNSKLGLHQGDVGDVVVRMIEALDESVGRIVDTLRALGIRERTLVFFTSDNGGYQTYAGGYTNVSSNGPLRGAKGSLYEGGHRVPGIASWPGRIQPGRITAATALTMDLAPTLLELAGVPLPARSGMHGFDGTSLGPLLFENRESAPRDLYWADRRGAAAIRRGPWKLILPTGEAPELYRLDDDISETRNLARAEWDRVSVLQAAVMEWQRSVTPATASGR